MKLKLPPIPHLSFLIDRNNLMTEPWLRWFQDLYNRVGGSDGIDINDSVNPDLQAMFPDYAYLDRDSGQNNICNIFNDIYYPTFWLRLSTNSIYYLQRILIGSNIDDGTNQLQVTGDAVISGNLSVGGGASGTFTTVDLKTVTVVDGIITSIV